MKGTTGIGGRPRAGAVAGKSAKGKARSSAERSFRLEKQLVDQVEELEVGMDDDDNDDDVESFDPIEEYGIDPLFDDGDPSESARPSGWDALDAPTDDEHEVAAIIDADVLVVPSAGGFAAVLSPVYRGKALRTDVEDENALQALCNEILRQQKEYLQSGDEARRRPLTQAALAVVARVHPGTVSRLVKNRTVELPWGEMASLDSLLASPTDARVGVIAQVLRELDVVERDGGGTVIAVRSLATKADIVARSQQQFGKGGTSEASVRRLMEEHDIPLKPEQRRLRYEEGSDWWS
jgi:hypothetical protein